MLIVSRLACYGHGHRKVMHVPTRNGRLRTLMCAPGHTTMTCPYRIAPELGCTPAAASDGVLNAMRKRERDGRRAARCA